MAGFLLDTSFLVALVDEQHVLHRVASDAITSMTADDLQFVSAITLGEIQTGVASVKRIHGRTPLHATQAISAAKQRPLLSVTPQVGEVYGNIKSAMVQTFMSKASKNKPVGYLEDWIDHATGKRLSINENDLWICSQGFERDLTVITCDKDFLRVEQAEPRLRLRLLRSI